MSVMKLGVVLPVLSGLAAVGAWAQPSVSSVVNAASNDAALSTGCWASVLGSGLADTTAGADAAPLPTTLEGVTVTVGGVPAELLYVSSTQINLIVPPSVAIPDNTVVPMVVTSSGAASRPYNLRLLRNAPGVFTSDGSGSGRALVFEGNLPAETVSPGDTVTFYATGLTAAETNEIEVYLGERRASFRLTRRANGLTGLVRIDLTAPLLASDRLYLRAGGRQSNITQVAVSHGANVSNITGSVSPQYPSANLGATPATTFALMLYAGSFSTALDIAPSAGPFDIAAVGEGGSSLISIDPTASCANDSGATSRGAYTASVGTITSDGAHADFSGSIVPLWDYATCSPTTWACLAFPLSTIPPARLGASWTAAVQALPAPTTILSAGANAVTQVSGCLADLLPSGSTHLTIDPQHNQIFAIFGGFQQLALGASKTRSTAFALYVDGVKIASQDVSFSVANRQ